MGIRIFFVLSFLFLLSGMIFVYKVPERVSLFRSMVICYVTELCFGAVVVGMYSLIGIPVELISLGIAYLVMGLLVWVIIIYQKKVQKVEIINWDVYTALVIVLWFSFIFIKVFSLSIKNVYILIDPARHFQWALNVLDTGKVSSMYFAEVYNAVVIKLLEPFLLRLTLYKAFILADSFANLINVFMFYCLMATFIKSRFAKVIAPFVSCLYFLGWPFYSYVIGGFVYFGWGVTLLAYVVYLLIKLYDSEDRRNQIVLLGLVLVGGFSLLACYLLFVVILVGIVLLSLAYTAKKNGFVLSKKRILTIGIMTLLLAIGIFAFGFWGYFKGDMTYVLRALQEDGAIARRLYQDFVFLMPGVFYMGWRYIRNKEVNIIFVSVSVILAFICFTLIMRLCGILSPYYYYKSYYLLWFFTWIINVAFIEYLLEKDKAILFSCGGTLLFVIVIALSGIDSRLTVNGIAGEVSYRLYSTPLPIWDYMKDFMLTNTYGKDNNFLIEVSEYVNEAFSEEEKVPAISSRHDLIGWYTGYTGNDYFWITSDEQFAKVLQECKDAGYQYIVVYQDSYEYRNNKELLSDFEIVYNNGYYGVYMLY